MIRTDWASQEKKSRLSLLGLPRELRDIVYDYATAHFEVRVGRKKLNLRGKSVEQRQRNTTAVDTGLLFVCKQLRNEAIQPYLKNTLFTFRSEEAAFAWLRTVPEYHRKFLKHVRLETMSDVKLFDIGLRKTESGDEVCMQREVKKLNRTAFKCVAAMGGGVFRELGMPPGFHFEVQFHRYQATDGRPRIEYSW
jgi:hypothetical protein